MRELRKSYAMKKRISLITEEKHLALSLPGINILQREDYSVVCDIDLKVISVEKLVHEITRVTRLKDLTIEDPSMAEVILTLYAEIP